MADLLTYIAASGMDASMKDISNNAHNLANINSGAFKTINTETKDTFYIMASQAGSAATEGEKPVSNYSGTGVKVTGTYRTLTQGARKQTGNSLDFYINGSGYVAVTLPNKSTAYYRATSLKVNSEGKFTTSEGYLLADDIAPITSDVDTQTIKISQQGQVYYSNTSGNDVTLGQITLYTFPNEQGLKALSGSYFQETDASGAPTQGKPGDAGYGTLDQEALELSNVEIATVFADFMAAQRAYELSARMLRSSEEMFKELNK
ncbi:MAG: flagellar hook basal-body protein [Rickettsiaceae bacterium]|nr:flagellar hook basal-body protein [Rickettsiaceae bacterium]